eukprot:TRINITY_DN13441_c1_g1_i23.p1 TRINITY_DN13441_c1_g1~~TRINITY_DN13441_c1_g1_i23.p1  ORF type:complete len:464 (+),score=117.36 TRINITY_DN13441_c1_g1_i23:314-1705(+)
MLEESFPYFGVPELRIVPLKIMKSIPAIPKALLEEIAKSPYYRECPIEVQRQIWDVNETLFRAEVFPLLKSYIEQYAGAKNIYSQFVLHYASKRENNSEGLSTPVLDPGGASGSGGGSVGTVDCGVSGTGIDGGVGSGGMMGSVGSGGGQVDGSNSSGTVMEDVTHGSLVNYIASKFPLEAPRKRRSTNTVLKQLLYIVGSSRSLYEKLLLQITEFFFTTSNNGFCTLFSEFLFSLLESDVEGVVSNGDPINSICLQLDELVTNFGDAGILHNIDLAVRRLCSVRTSTIVINASSGGYKTKSIPNKPITDFHPKSGTTIATLTGMTAGATNTLIEISPHTSINLAILLRDPYATIAIITALWNRLEFCLDRDQLPRDDEHLPLLTQLLNISCHARKIISKKKYKEKTKSTVTLVQQFYPLMVLYMLDNEFNVPIKFSNLGNSFDSIFKKEKVARKVILIKVKT